MKYLSIILSLLFFVQGAYAKSFSVGTYNVENLFDLVTNKTEYPEFRKNNHSSWNKRTQKIKINNISKVIKLMDVDILALEEIENKNVLTQLFKRVKIYKYEYFLKNPNSAIGLGLFSKYKISKTKAIKVLSLSTYSRPILQASILINKKPLMLLISHWRSKKAGENYRIEYALSIKKAIQELPQNSYFIVLGDFNSNYNEDKTLKYDKKLNTSHGITGINQVLNTSYKNHLLSKRDIKALAKQGKKNILYNLWLDLPSKNRFSYFYKGEKQTIDNILIPPILLENSTFSYIDKSFRVFKPSFIFRKNKKYNKIYSWQKRHGHFIGKGYSDHLPIYAFFSENSKAKTKENNFFEKSLKKFESLTRFDYDLPKSKNTFLKNHISSIASLYKINSLEKPIILKNIFVIYKSKNIYTIKRKNDRAISLYISKFKLESNPKLNLALGSSFDIQALYLDDFFGKKELKDIKILKEHKSIDYKKYFLDASNINLFSRLYQNEVIKNLRATYHKAYLYYNYKNKSKKIRLYAKNKSILPKNNAKILVLRAKLTKHRNKIQLFIQSKDDYKVLK